MINKFAYIQTSDETKLVRVCLHEENDYDQMNQIEIVESDEISAHAFNLVNTLNKKWLTLARQVAREEGLTLRQPQTMAIN